VACCTDGNHDVVAALMEVPGQGDDALIQATKDGWTPEKICALYGSGSTKAFFDRELIRILESRGNEKGDNQPQLDVLQSDKTTSPEEPTDLAKESAETAKPPEPVTPKTFEKKKPTKRR
jgi:hypothetical protein